MLYVRYSYNWIMIGMVILIVTMKKKSETPLNGDGMMRLFW